MAENVPELNIHSDDLEMFQESMQHGTGVFHKEHALSDDWLTQIQTEINDAAKVPFRNGSMDFVNQVRARIQQVFDAYALKLKLGNPEPLSRAPYVMGFVLSVEKLVTNALADIFPGLADWEADEAVLQRYPRNEGKLSYHKDNKRHTGLIVIGTLEGEGSLSVKDVSGTEDYQTSQGSLVILRAPDLFESDKDLRPEHAVSGITTTRTSLTVRSNVRPDDSIFGFSYDNWPGNQSHADN